MIPEAVDGLTRVGGFTIAPAVDRTVTVSATRLAELEAEEATLLRAEPTAPPTMTRLTIPT